ncbi:MAG: hypothetical protein ACI4NO_00365 [Oxalobacter sp.]
MNKKSARLFLPIPEIVLNVLHQAVYTRIKMESICFYNLKEGKKPEQSIQLTDACSGEGESIVSAESFQDIWINGVK